MFQGCKNLCLSSLLPRTKVYLKCMSTLSTADIVKKRNLLFNEEKKKQKAAIGRIEKIEVKYQTTLDEVVLIMNKNISTPADCTRHISEGIEKISALALVNGEPWDMQKPLTSDCELKLITMKDPTREANFAFWRTCSLLLGAVVENAFKENIKVHLHSFPVPVIQAGSFVYDVFLDLPEWQPLESELRALSASFVKLSNSELPIEMLKTTEEVALEIFQTNPFKSEQIPHIAQSNNGKVTLYRVGDHIDISKGPMVGNTRIIGRITIASVHKLTSVNPNLYRFQGVALPKGIMLNHFAYNILENRAKKLNKIPSISTQTSEEEEERIISVKN